MEILRVGPFARELVPFLRNSVPLPICPALTCWANEYRRAAAGFRHGPGASGNASRILLSHGKASEFCVEAEGGDYDWAAVSVVAGIVDVLEAGGDVEAAPEMHRVVGLDDVLAAVVEVSVT